MSALWFKVLDDAGVDCIIGVPASELAGLFCVSAQDVIIATREDEAMGIAAGISLAGGRPLVAMQSSGVGNALNAIASLVVPYGFAFPILVSIRGGNEEKNAVQDIMGRIVPDVLSLVGLEVLMADCLDRLTMGISERHNAVAVLCEPPFLKTLSH